MHDLQATAAGGALLEAADAPMLMSLNPMVGEKRVGSRRMWTTREERVLRATYPTGGSAACLPLLPGRSAYAVTTKARAMKLRRLTPAGAARKLPERYRQNPQIDQAIVALYSNAPDRGAVMKFARTLNRSPDWLTRRAAKLGCTVPRFKDPDWSEAELALLRANPQMDAVAHSRLLRRHGFSRSPGAVNVRRKLLRIRQGTIDGVMTGGAVAEALGCTRGTLARHIAEGRLKAKRKAAGWQSQGGDEKDRAWVIREVHLREFIINNVAAIDLGRVDKFWLVDLLAGPRTSRVPAQ